MPLPTPARDYLLRALEGTPDVLSGLIGHLDSKAPEWDTRPDPERFTLREVVAHLADWEPIWLERFQRMAAEDHPQLPSIDEGEIAQKNDYAHSEPTKSLARFRAGRAQLVEFLHTLPDEAWDRLGERAQLGVLSLQQFVLMALAHDGYHMRQVALWLAK